MRYLRTPLLGLLAPRKAAVAVFLPTLLSAAIVSILAIAGLFPGAARANPGPSASPTPVATVVTPVVEGVNPVEEVVTPVSGTAEATTVRAQEIGGEGEGSGNLFTGVRGGLIGAGIALGMVVVATVVIRGGRALVKQRHR